MIFGSVTPDFDQISTVHWDIHVNGSTTDPRVVVADDPSELREIGTDFLDANWRYVNSLGDGGVIGEIGGNSWDIVIDPVLYTGFNTSLAAYGATGTSLALDINTSEAIVFRVSSVPEPGTLALLAISLVVLSRRYKRTV